MIGHDGSNANIGMRRNALHPKGTSFGARLLTPYNNPRCALRGLISAREATKSERQSYENTTR